jgi:isopentenyl-diphosphate delta-isomerase
MSAQFEQRKHDHLKHALDESNQAVAMHGFQSIQLNHDSLPELNLSDVSIESQWLDETLATPFFIAGMTAGHDQANALNATLASCAESRGWLFGVGSQRRQYEQNQYQDDSILNIRAQYPKLKLISNFGIAQLIHAHQSGNFSKIISLIESISAQAIAIHLNPLQEAIQTEGTPQYKGAAQALKDWIKECPVPVIVKETGSGMSRSTLAKIIPLDPFAIDVSGAGGTHWGRIEGKRAAANSVSARLGETFSNWGISTVESLAEAVQEVNNLGSDDFPELWASGGVRSGLDAAKLFALGATRVGFAQPALKAALQGTDALDVWMQTIEQELKVAMFCTGSANLTELNLDKLKGVSDV